MKSDPTAPLSDLEFSLINRFQRDFPLVSRPFAALAQKLKTDEAAVIDSLRRLTERGLVSRVGAVFQPHSIGTSTLAALSVPQERLEEVAGIVSRYTEINHNYEREHRYNLWFVVTAPSPEHLATAVRDIETACQCGPVLFLPMCQQYHIDLGFDLSGNGNHVMPARTNADVPRSPTISLSAADQQFVSALQEGLPLVERPFAQLGRPEAEAIDTIGNWVDDGVIKRFGIVVRHLELGYTANAMAVWDVPDDVVDEVGRSIAATGRVTLCYRRIRQLPDWPYNLFCMIHGKDRDDVTSRIEALSKSCGLGAYPHAVLFSRRRFKQRGAHYATAAANHAATNAVSNDATTPEASHG
ncbi:Lrp/AsnC family transcriptional regulator [Noviherbaspirillum agri]